MNPALYKDPNLGMPPVREIVLHGELARKFGKVHHYRARSAAHALRYLCQMVPGLQRELGEAAERGVAYQMWVNGRNVGKDDLKFRSSGRIYLSPVLQGSKRAGTLQTIIGIVLIVVGVIFWAYGGEALVIAGAGMLASGIIQMLAPQPKQDKQNQLKSSFFDGPVNVTAQGNPVPIAYGEMMIGSAVISGGITIDDAAASGTAPAGTGGGGGDGGYHQWSHHPPPAAQ